jgi:hypothetical protein
MAFKQNSNGGFSVKAYIGDNKTLLAFNFAAQSGAKNLAGFSIQCKPDDGAAYYLWNELQFADPSKHAQVSAEKSNSTVNAPIQKFRWTHVTPAEAQSGNYTYTVTPRYFDAGGAMLPLDSTKSTAVTVPVGPFAKNNLSIGFTRGYMQSEAFLHHFGAKTPIKPKAKTLIFDTSAVAGQNGEGQNVTFAQIYQWMGATAREKVFDILDQVQKDPTLSLKVFAYDLDEPDVIKALLALAAQGRLRMILDNAALHVNKSSPTPEDQFTMQFNQQAKGAAKILRGCFARYSHDKIFIVVKGDATSTNAQSVLTGSTNFSMTGLYVNANHVLVFNDAQVAGHYSQVFEESWQVLSADGGKTGPSKSQANAFAASPLATTPYAFQSTTLPKTSITYSPHSADDTNTILNGVVTRISSEPASKNGSVLFAVMQLTGSDTPVYNKLNSIHSDQSVFSYGISDAPSGIYLYSPNSNQGVLVSGKVSANLPAPFDQLPTPPGHEIHDKFIVCGLNGADPTVYCGSSNLATGGEESNGDNLLAIHDADVATAFAIEALLLVDHYNFLDHYGKKVAANAAAAKTPKPKTSAKKAPAKKAAKKATKKAPAKKAAKKAPAKKAAKKTPAKKASKSKR